MVGSERIIVSLNSQPEDSRLVSSFAFPYVFILCELNRSLPIIRLLGIFVYYCKRLINIKTGTVSIDLSFMQPIKIFFENKC